MPLRRHWLVFMLLFFLPLSALAEVYARLGAGAARSTGRGDYLGAESTTRFRDTDATAIGGLGLRLNRWLSLEGTYIETDVFFADDVLKRDISGSGFGVSAFASLPLSERWAVTGRYGIWRWDMDIKPSVQHGSDRFKGRDRVIGAGVEYQAAPRAILHLAFDDYAVEDIDLRTLTFSVRFLLSGRANQPSRE